MSQPSSGPESHTYSSFEVFEQCLVPGIILVSTVVYAWGVRDIAKPNENLLLLRPVLLVIWVLLAIVIVRFVVQPVIALRESAKRLEGDDAAGPSIWSEAYNRLVPMGGWRPLLLVVVIVAYTATAFDTSFPLATLLFMVVVYRVQGGKSVVEMVALGLGTAAVLYYLGRFVLLIRF